MELQRAFAKIVDSGLITPSVSVLMSVFNCERWLSESIQSVLEQTFTDFEFIIVNDGSRDGSLEIINQFADQDSRIRFFDKPNTGLADSLNYGIERATGDWIARIDADDICEPQRLAKQIELARVEKDLVLIGTGLKLIDQYGLDGKAYEYPAQHKKLSKRLANGGSFFAHSSAMFRTKLARECGGYRVRFRRSQDHDLWLRLSERGFLGCVKEPLVFIRKHGDQISHDEGGRRQSVDSHIAMVCYWLRQMQYEDPVNSLSDSRFSDFHGWVESEMESAGVFELNDYITELKIKMVSSDTKRARYADPISSLIRSPQYSYRWIINRCFGSGLPKSLALKWIAEES